jgi:hypothetical protein
MLSNYCLVSGPIPLYQLNTLRVSNVRLNYLDSLHPATHFSFVILRSPAGAGRRRISWLLGFREILRRVYPERLDLSSSTGPAEGLRMTLTSSQPDTL